MDNCNRVALSIFSVCCGCHACCLPEYCKEIVLVLISKFECNFLYGPAGVGENLLCHVPDFGVYTKLLIFLPSNRFVSKMQVNQAVSQVYWHLF